MHKPKLDDDLHKRYLRALTSSSDDLSAALIGASVLETVMSVYLRSQMPNYSKRFDPLLVEGSRMGLSPMVKLAFALGFVDRQTFDGCRDVGALRNEAAHLKKGPEFSFSNPASKKIVDRLFSNVQVENVDPSGWINRRKERGASLERARYEAAIAWLSAFLEVEIDFTD